MPATKQAASTLNQNHRNWRFYKPLHPVTGKPCPHPKSGWKFAYDDDEDSPDKRSFVSLDRDGRIAWGPDETKVPRLKRMLHEVETNVGKSVFQDYSDGEKQTSAMFGRSGVFLAPKHADFVSRFIVHAAKVNSIILDCFGGSGSTAHAVIKLNRDDRGARKYVLVEVGEYFDTVLKPRVLKAAYSRDWKGGKPVSREGISQCVKVIRLESYEDALNNLELRRTKEQQGLLDLASAQGADKLKEHYMLRYLLDVETRGSQSLLNVAAFTDPTAYKLRVKRHGSDESREVNVDLLETFNWLIGLTVQHLAAPQTFTAETERDGEGRLRLKDRLKQDADGRWWFRTVTGTTPDERKTLVIWRKRPGGESAEGIEQDNLILDEWFTKQGYSSKDSEFDLIYVNGDNNLENLKAPDDTWKVRLIEEDFFRLMFEMGGV
jgi:adenine-specific DNA-methyltransferase